MRASDGPAPARPTITLRGLGLFLVVLVAFIVLAPTLRHAIEQQEELRDLTARVEQARARNAGLEAELARWQDPIFVQAQARDRLGYVLPGETTYRVIDPETVVGEEGADPTVGLMLPQAARVPWYVAVWDSIQVAGETAPDGELPADGTGTPSAVRPATPTP